MGLVTVGRGRAMGERLWRMVGAGADLGGGIAGWGWFPGDSV
jgi:hypothetical protein